MYANIYQIRSSKYNFDKNIYETSIRQKNIYPEDKQISGAFSNKRTNSSKYINQSKGNQYYINYNLSNNNITKTKPIAKRRINSSK